MNVTGIFALIVTLLCAAILYERYEIKIFQEKIDALNNQVGACTTANVVYKTQVDTQNSKIDDLQKQAADREAAGKQIIASANKSALANMNRAQVIKSMLTSGDQCQASENIVNAYFKQLGIAQ